MQQATVTVGIGFDKQGWGLPPEQVETATEKFEQTILQVFGGYTRLTGVGACNSGIPGSTAFRQEPVYHYIILLSNSADLEALDIWSAILCNDLAQESVLILVTELTVKRFV